MLRLSNFYCVTNVEFIEQVLAVVAEVASVVVVEVAAAVCWEFC